MLQSSKDYRFGNKTVLDSEKRLWAFKFRDHVTYPRDETFLCFSLLRIYFFFSGKRDKNSCNISSFDSWQFVVNASHISQSYSAWWGQRMFHWAWLCEQSLFFLLGLPPSFLASRRFVAQRLGARALPLLNLEKKRDYSQSKYLVPFVFNLEIIG